MKTLLKGLVVFAVSLALLTLLYGCGANPNAANGNATALWTDPSTGCRYILFRDGIGSNAVGSLSIRFNADGTPDCPGVKHEQALP